jgi:protocatechuate 3,4-dioxygenase beta subunit
MKTHELRRLLLLGLLAFFCLLLNKAWAEKQLPKTPADYEGPFYPVTGQEDIDNNLVQVKGRTGIAKGDILNLSGRVVTTGGKPLAGLIIEIWQTDPQGRYRHPGDTSPGARDPDFQYWGAAITDDDGGFFFRTIVPGAYNPRPPHIHFKVLRDHRVILTSQIYFRDQDTGAGSAAKSSQSELQTVDLQPVSAGEFKTFFRIVL